MVTGNLSGVIERMSVSEVRYNSVVNESSAPRMLASAFGPIIYLFYVTDDEAASRWFAIVIDDSKRQMIRHR